MASTSDPCAAAQPAGLAQASRSPAAASLQRAAASTVLELLRPGEFVRLRNQPEDLPPFQLIRCRGGRCWVRQQAWGTLVQWEVAHRQLTSVA